MFAVTIARGLRIFRDPDRHGLPLAELKDGERVTLTSRDFRSLLFVEFHKHFGDVECTRDIMETMVGHIENFTAEQGYAADRAAAGLPPRPSRYGFDGLLIAQRLRTF